MQLTLTFSDGTTQTVPFSTASTLQVSTDDAIQGTWTSVASLSLADDPVEVVDGPAQVVLDPTAGVVAPDGLVPVTPDPTSSDSGTAGSDDGATVTVLPDGTQIAGTGTSNPAVTDTTLTPDETVAPESTDDTPADPVAADAPVEAPADTPTPDSVGAALAAADAADASAAADAAVADTETAVPQADTPAPDEAVAQVNDGIDTAVAGSAPDQEAHLKNLSGLIDSLLESFPDDDRLKDAKLQAADLAADLSAELG